MGVGYASGDGRAVAAARAAISSPLLEASIEGARGHPAERERAVRPRAVRAQRGGRDHRPGRAPRRQHHLRCGDRRRARRRGAHHRDRGRLRPLRGRAAAAPSRHGRAARSVSTTRTRSSATTRSTSATTTSTSPSSCADRRSSSRGHARPGARLVQRPARWRLGAAVRRPCNVGDHVGDDPGAVVAQPAARRRRRPGSSIPSEWVWMRPGARRRRCTSPTGRPASTPPEADAAVTTTSAGLPLAILTADCAPIVVRVRRRGRRRARRAPRPRAGVIEATAVARCARSGTATVRAYLGPCIRAGALRVRRRRPRATRRPLRARGRRAAPTTGAGARHSRRGPHRAAARRASTASTTAACARLDSADHFSYRRDGTTGRQVTVAVLT